MRYQLKEFFYISNLLSLARIVMIFPIIYLLTLETSDYNLLILTLCIFTALTDFLDGYLSRKLNIVTELGIVLDPLADKISMAAILGALVIYRDFHISLVIYLVARDLLIIIIGAFVVRKVDKPIMANIWGKINTTLIAILAILFLMEFDNYFYTFLLFASYLTILISSLSYARIAETILFSSIIVKYLFRSAFLILTIVIVDFAMHVDFSAYPDRPLTSAGDKKHESMIQDFAPVLYFCKDENYFPSPVQAFLHRSIIKESYPLLVFDPIRDMLLPEAMQVDEGSETYITLDKPLFGSIRDHYNKARSTFDNTVYARVIQTTDNGQTVTIIQYWFFYWAGQFGSIDITHHEGDWQMIMVYLDQHLRPLKAGYSQHCYGEVRPWDRLEHQDSHPVVYVSCAGHDSYFSPGTYTAYYDQARTIALGSDYCAADLKWEVHKNYTIQPINDDMYWVHYRGYWGFPFLTKTNGPKWMHPDDKNLAMWQNPLGWFGQFDKSSE